MAIIGSGISGLYLGYLLSNLGWQITIYEKNDHLGGLAGSFSFNNHKLDKYYRHIFPSHAEIKDLIKRLKLQEFMITGKAVMGYFDGQVFFDFNTPKDLLLFKGLSIINRFRVGVSIVSLLLQQNVKRLDTKTVEEVLVPISGQVGYDSFWKPLLVNKFGDSHKQISAVWLWDRINSRKKTNLYEKKESLGYLVDSFDVLLKKLAQEIIAHGGHIHTSTTVKNIGQLNGEVTVTLTDGKKNNFQHCTATLSNPDLLKILETPSDSIVQMLSQVEYMHSICLILRLKSSLSPYYWINMGTNAAPFAALIEHTNLVDAGHYGGEHIVYLSKYVSSEANELTSDGSRQFESECIGYLEQIFPDFKCQQIINRELFKERNTQPIFKRNYSTIKPAFDITSNIHLLNSSQFYPFSRCMNTSILLANQFVKSMDK